MISDSVTSAVAPEKKTLPPRLHFLDGLRGLAALYVVLFHAKEEIFEAAANTAHMPLFKAVFFLNYGHYSVDIFIVLSGYCLMLPVVRSLDGQLRGGFREYILRRARRILPPYYAALLLSLMLVFLLPGALASPHSSFALQQNAFTPGSLVSHLLLLHNLNDNWIQSIDPPTWSVATEWQIYFVFPLLLLPVWRRFGAGGALTAGVLLSLLVVFCLPRFHSACFWYIGLFAFGMAAAARMGKSNAAETRNAGIAALVLGLLLAALAKKGGFQTSTLAWAADFMMGGASAFLLIFLAGSAHGKSNPALRFFETRFALWLGTFSYSLYLVHFQVLCVLHIALNAARVPPQPAVIVLLTAGTALSFALSYLFYLAFEKPFVRAAVKAKNAASESEKVPT